MRYPMRRATPPIHTPPTSLVTEARRWAAHALQHSRLPTAYVCKKALDALEFTLRSGLSGLAIPTKLSGLGRALRALTEGAANMGTPLDLDPTEGGVRASYEGEPLGFIQPKHAGWILPLLPFGLTLHLIRVVRREGPEWHVNVFLGNVGEAVREFERAFKRAHVEEEG